MSAYKTYLFSYTFEGQRWSFEMQAASPEEARERVSRLMYATYDGELKAKIYQPIGWFAKLICWFQNKRQAA